MAQGLSWVRGPTGVFADEIGFFAQAKAGLPPQ